MVDGMTDSRDNNGRLQEVLITDKTPLLSISPAPIEIWYEGPDYVVADKPPGMLVHPEDASGHDTLVNALFQSNRWLAEMETSHRPGVVHRLNPTDRGLVLVGKTDEIAPQLREQHKDGQFTFSYRVRLPASMQWHDDAPVTVFNRQTYPDGMAVMDIDSPIGDTDRLRQLWLDDPAADVFFVLYRLDIPRNGSSFRVAFGDRGKLPTINLYTVPPCSVCNGTKNFLALNGFWYADHDLNNKTNIEPMRELRGNQRGIPVVQIDEEILVGFERRRLKNLLGLY